MYWNTKSSTYYHPYDYPSNLPLTIIIRCLYHLILLQIRYTLNYIKKAPNNQSPWTYLKGWVDFLSSFPNHPSYFIYLLSKRLFWFPLQTDYSKEESFLIQRASNNILQSSQRSTLHPLTLLLSCWTSMKRRNPTRVSIKPLRYVMFSIFYHRSYFYCYWCSLRSPLSISLFYIISPSIVVCLVGESFGYLPSKILEL